IAGDHRVSEDDHAHRRRSPGNCGGVSTGGRAASTALGRGAARDAVLRGQMQEFADKFALSTLTVARYDHWVVSVRPVQTTLGALVLSLGRPCAALGELTPDEGAELAVI